MNYPQTSTTDPYAFSLWPDASAFGEETTVWAGEAGYSQPGLIGDSFALGDLDPTTAWGQSATLPAATYGHLNDTNWTSGGMVPVGDMLGHGALLADATATDTMTFASAPAPPFPTDGTGFTEDFFNQSDFSDLLSSTPSLTIMGPVTSPQNDGTMNGDISFPSFEGASSYVDQPSGVSLSQVDTTKALQPDSFTWAPPSLFIGDGNLAGQPPPNYLPLDLMNVNGNMSYPMQSEHTQAYGHVTEPAALTVTVTGETVPSSLGKRSRESDHNESGPQKRARTNATRVPRGAQSTKQTRRSPATMTRKTINNKSKAAGCGAEMLASTTARGVYHRSSPGLNVSQGSMGVLGQGQPSWIEERDVEVDTWHDAGSSVLRQIALQSAENAEDGDLHKIPGNLSARQRLMLQTSKDDDGRGAVRVIKCKLCPAARFGTWETYKRHCKSCEKHPSELKFCPRCGDYFGRPDSGIRHHKDKKYQEACLSTLQDEAREKKQKVELLLKEFEAKLEHCLKNGEEIGPRFSDIVNKKLTNTSKKVSKQKETRLEGDSWAAGLC